MTASAVSTEGRVTFADLAGISESLATADLDRDLRTGLVKRLRAEYGAQETSWREGDGKFSEALHGAIKAMLIEEEKREAERGRQAYNAQIEGRVAAMERQRIGRLERWAALSPVERALYLVGEQTGNDTFVRIANLIADPRTAGTSACPRNFEPA